MAHDLTNAQASRAFADPASCGSLVEVLRGHATAAPAQTAFTYLTDGEDTEEPVTFGELDRRARAIGTLLQWVGANGTALLLYPPGLDYIAAFYGCMYGGIISVPAYPPQPSHLERSLPRLIAIAKDSRATIGLTTSALLETIESVSETIPELKKLRWIATDAVTEGTEEGWTPPAVERDSTAFLQYTSGSTGMPKGVIVTHENLLANAAAILQLSESKPDTTVVTWLPPFHDMGLIGCIVFPVCYRFPTYVMSPAHFLQRPFRWLQAISRYKATISPAPNFAYDLCVRKVRPDQRSQLDLRSWQCAINGAEPIRRETLERFQQAFGPCGFAPGAMFPAYGLAEATLIVSGHKGPLHVLDVDKTELGKGVAVPCPPDSPRARSLVSCGVSANGQRIAIVDPERKTARPAFHEGEICVQGMTVAHGYWDKPDVTEETFGLKLAGGDGTSFLRTGDLGFQDEAGRVYVTGRIKDLMIIRGRNHYPQDVELTVDTAHGSIRPGCAAAFTVDVDGEERVVIAVEVERRRRAAEGAPDDPRRKTPVTPGNDPEDPPEFSPEAVIAAVRDAVGREHELQVHAVVLVKAGRIPKTSSGKIQRRACKLGYLDGTLDAVALDVLKTTPKGAGRPAAKAPTLGTSRAANRDLVLAAESGGERTRMIEIFLRDRVAACLERSASRVGVGHSATSLGLDSIMAVEIANDIRTFLGVELPVRTVFEAASLTSIAETLVAALSSGETTASSIPASPRVGAVPLSFAQQRLWFLDRLEPGGIQYNEAAATRVRGATLDYAALRECVSEVFRRHEALRTTFVVEAGEPEQRIAPPGEAPVAITDLSGLARDAAEARAQELLLAESRKPFDLVNGPLARVLLLKLDAQEHVLGLIAHHIVCDGWSLGVVFRELEALYRAFLAQQPSPLPDLPIQYADFAVWQREWLSGKELKRQITYWRDQLAGLPPLLDLPTDRPRPATQTYKGARHALALSPELTRAVKELGRKEGVTPFMTLLAAFQTLLARLSGQDRICVGTPVACRTRSELEPLIGVFVNMLPLATDLSGDPTFRQVLSRARDTALGAYAHQDVPFEKLVDELKPPRDMSRHPIFQVSFVFQNATGAALELSELSLSPLELDRGTSKFDLTLELEEKNGGLAGALEYNVDLFDRDTIARLAERFQRLLAGVVADPGLRVAAAPIVSEKEREQLASWNATARPFRRGVTLHELVSEQAAKTPDAEAVQFEGDALTYRELDQKANQVARRLLALGVKRGSLVGIAVERSLEMVTGLLGILKAGAGYVPIDPEYPRDRVAFMLSDARPAVLLSQRRIANRLPESKAQVLLLDDRAALAGESADPLPAGATEDDPAYGIYTSGSTGKPKLVVIPHRAIVNHEQWMQATFPLGRKDAVLQKTPFSFDASVWEFFSPLIAGARLVLARPGGHRDPAYLVDAIASERITVVQLVPSLLRALLEVERFDRCKSLKHVFCGGEALTTDLQDRFFERHPADLVNLYGPAEAAIDSTWWVCRREDRGRSVPIGKPVANTTVHVLDAHRRPVPIGVPGELWLGGAQLALGYHGRPELTAERFVDDVVPGAGRLYRTGDLARMRADGALEYLGRADHQVKLRGFRIELGEIEAVLAEHPRVAEPVAIVREDAPGTKRLVAYFVAKGAAPTTEELRAHLAGKLPEYMVPAHFVPLAVMPLSPSGKVDRGALPKPEGAQAPLGTAFAEPASDAEKKLAEIWRAVLGVERVGSGDDFFALGGDSILVMQVIWRASSAGLRFTPKEFFQNPTIARLAQVARRGGPSEAATQDSGEPFELTPIQSWFFEHDFAERHHWNQAVDLELQHPVDADVLTRAVAHVAAHHEALRLRFLRREGGWRQQIATDAGVTLSRIDLSSVAPDARKATLEAALAALETSLDLEKGPLARFALVTSGGGSPDHLVIVVHHLAVDGVSWRILLEDVETAYLQLADNHLIELLPRSTSFREWTRRLVEHARSEKVAAELPFWLERGQVAPLPRDGAAVEDLVGTAEKHTATLDAASTRALLSEAPRAYHTQVDDALLAALARTLSEWTRSSRVLVDLEGHGREPFADTLDVSRTLGWFTTISPVALAVEPGDVGSLLVSVKEQRRKVPNRGLGHGLLRYAADAATAAKLAALPPAEVIFNYLGQVDGTYARSTLFRPGSTTGPTRSPRGRRPYPIEINALVIGERLEVEWSFQPGQHRRATIERLAKDFLATLEAIVAHCKARPSLHTPTDFPMADLSQDKLDRIRRRIKK